MNCFKITLIIFILLLLYCFLNKRNNFTDYSDYSSLRNSLYNNLSGNASSEVTTTTANSYTCAQLNGITNLDVKANYCKASSKCDWKCDNLKSSESAQNKDDDGNYRKCCVDKTEQKKNNKKVYKKSSGIKGATKELCDKYDENIDKFNLQINRYKQAIGKLEAVKKISKDNCKLYIDCKLDGDQCSFSPQ